MRALAYPGTMGAKSRAYRRQTLLDANNPLQYATTDATNRLDGAQAALAVSGDPVVCRALVLLLKGPDYDVRYLPVASLGMSGTLTGVQILLLALAHDTERRRRIFELLDRATINGCVHIAELTSVFEGSPERRREHNHADWKISWPCSTEQLKRHIDTALAASLLVDGSA